jgi:alpha-N-arabinofuranosidase
VLWRGAVLGAVWAEGPHLYRVDGAYYLLAAEGGTEFHHAISVARSDAVTGPYVGNRANPVLTHRHLGRDVDVVGVGHADLVEAPDGSWWAVLLGMRPYGGYHYNLGRETFLVPVTWEDGWPVFAPGQGRVPAVIEVPDGVRAAGGADSAAGVAPAWPPAGPVLPGDLRWTGLRGPADFAEPHGAGWLLRVRPESLTDAATPAFLGVRQQHQDVTVRTVLRFDPAGPDEQAGLAVRQSERDHVLLVVTGSPGVVGRRVRAVHRRAGVDTVLGERPLPDGDDPVTLAVQARGQDYVLLAGAGDEPLAPVATADGRTLDSVAAGGFLGVWLGLIATSDGAPSATVVTVDRFEYEPTA